MKRKLATMALASALVCSQGLTAFAAQEVDMSTGAGQGVVPTEFTALASEISTDPDNVEGVLIVTVPDELDLIFDEVEEVYTKTDVVDVKGNILPNQEVAIKTSADVTYVHVDDAATIAPGEVEFGDATGLVKVTAQDLLAVNKAQTYVVSNDLTSTVQLEHVEYIGDYSTDLVFDITLQDQE